MVGKIGNNQGILNQLRKTQSNMQDRLRALSSGQRVSAKNDPAGLAISESLRSQISGLETTNRGLSMEQSSLRIEEGSVSSAREGLQRMREIAIQSANGTISDQDRQNLQQEFEQLQSQVSSTLSGTGLSDLDLNDSGVATQGSAEDALEAIDSALNEVNSESARLGAKQNALEFRQNANDIQRENLAAARSEIADVDLAQEISELQKAKFLQEAQIQVLKTQQNASKSLSQQFFGGLDKSKK